MCTRPDNPTYRRYDPIFFYYLLASFAATYDDCPPTFPSNLKMRLKLREITGDMYQRSRPAIVSDEKKKSHRRLRDRRNIRTAWASIGLRLTILGMYVARAGTTVWQMSTSGTGGLGFPVGCTSDQAKLAVSMTDACVRQAECRRRLDSGHSRASCRQINTSKCLDPTSYQHYHIIHATWHCRFTWFSECLRHTNRGL